MEKRTHYAIENKREDFHRSQNLAKKVFPPPNPLSQFRDCVPRPDFRARSRMVAGIHQLPARSLSPAQPFNSA